MSGDLCSICHPACEIRVCHDAPTESDPKVALDRDLPSLRRRTRYPGADAQSAADSRVTNEVCAYDELLEIAACRTPPRRRCSTSGKFGFLIQAPRSELTSFSSESLSPILVADSSSLAEAWQQQRQFREELQWLEEQQQRQQQPWQPHRQQGQQPPQEHPWQLHSAQQGAG